MSISISKFYCNESYLKVVTNKNIMFKQLITVGIRKFCVVGNLSGEFIQLPPLGSVVLYVTRHQNVITAEYNRQHSIK